MDIFGQLVAAWRRTATDHPQLRGIVLAQWMLESGRGTSTLAREHLNFAGLKWRAEMAPFATRVNHAAHDGRDAYCRFASVERFVAGYRAFLARVPYRGWERHVASAEAFIRFIGPIYTPSPGYADKVLALLPEAERLLGATVNLGTIVIDPGHGGTQGLPGSSANNATSVSGFAERLLTLEFGIALRAALRDQAAMAGETLKVVLTRESDVNLAAAARAAMAGAVSARAFLSLHFNGSVDAAVRGTETFYRAAENGNVNLPGDLAFARAVQSGLVAGWRGLDKGAKDRGVRPDTLSGPGGLAVLNDRALAGRSGRRCAAALAEIEFITNPAVDRMIVSGAGAAAHRATLAASLAGAVLGHLWTG